MTVHRTATVWASLLALAATAACDDTLVEPESEGRTFVSPGKEDNFLASSAQEYLVSGRTFIELDAADASLSDAKKLEKVKRLIPFKQVVVSWFLNAWLAPKDKDDKNYGYGGFSALTRNGAFEDLDIRKETATRYSFTTRQQLAGPMDLLEVLPVTRQGGKLTFELAVGRISNTEMQKLGAGAEWFRSAPWDKFDPRVVDASQFDMMTLDIVPQPRSLDGWVDTPTLFADGKLEVAVHFGWDYHSASHLSGSKALFKWLVKEGFKPPVDSWEKLTRTSAAFTKTITANKKPVKVSVWVYFGKPKTTADPDTDQGAANLKKDLIKSLETREVIIYSGHSGPFWGFSMGNWNKTEAGELEDNELRALNLPKTYQLVFAEGCETYTIGESFFANPAKIKRDNLDIVTTTTYSTAEDADPVEDMLEALVGVYRNKHVPWLWSEVLLALDYNAYDAAMYGVHGIDDTPRLHPYADAARFCQSCSKDSDCGAEGNFCVGLAGEGKVCTAECTGDDGCPSGYGCAAVADGVSLTGRACIPRSFSCKSGTVPSGQLVINEVLADPPAGRDGDMNGDGQSDDGDEFVELVNGTDKELTLDGWTVSDGTAVRFTFPSNTKLAKGKAAVVFGGGASGALGGTGAKGFVASGLSFANSGDTVVVRNASGVVVDRVVYGAEGGRDKSLVRGVDGSRDAGFVPHAGAAASPGLKSNGAPF